MKLNSCLLVFALFSASVFAARPTCGPARKPLFKTTETLHITLKAPFPLDAQDPSSAPMEPAELVYEDKGVPVNIPLKVQVRGKSRFSTCDFKPMRLIWDETFDRDHGLFDHAGDDMKLVSHCYYTEGGIDDHEEANEWVLREYALFKVLEAADLPTYEVRLARMEYKSMDDKPVAEAYGFFLEPNQGIEKRCDTKHGKALNARSLIGSMDKTRMIPFLLARLLVNCSDYIYDWDHNAEIFLDQAGAIEAVIPYDFNDSFFLKKRNDWLMWEFAEPFQQWFNKLKQGPFTRDGNLYPELSPEELQLWTPDLIAQSKALIDRHDSVIATVDGLPLKEASKAELKAMLENFYSHLRQMVQELGG